MASWQQQQQQWNEDLKHANVVYELEEWIRQVLPTLPGSMWITPQHSDILLPLVRGILRRWLRLLRPCSSVRLLLIMKIELRLPIKSLYRLLECEALHLLVRQVLRSSCTEQRSCRSKSSEIWHYVVKQVVTSVSKDCQCLHLQDQTAHLISDCQTMDRRTAWAFKICGTTQTMTEHGILEDLKLQQHCCENMQCNHKLKMHSTHQISRWLYMAQHTSLFPTTTENIFISLFPDVFWLDAIFCYTHRFMC